MPSTRHPDLQIVRFVTLLVDSNEEIVTEVGEGEAPICKIPENCTYITTIHFIVKNRTLKNLHYRQDVKKAGITVKTRHMELGPEFAPRDEPYAVTVPKDTTPGGFMFRGKFGCNSIYMADKEVLMEIPWQLEITKA